MWARQAEDLPGSYGGTKEDMAEVYAFLGTGELAPVYSEIPFTGLLEGIDRLEKGTVEGRLDAHVAF